MAIERRVGNRRMSGAVIHGRTAYLSGVVAGASCARFEDEVRACLAALDDALRDAGTDRSHLVLAAVFLADLRRIDAFNEVWEAWAPPDALPARVAVQTGLVDPDRRVAVQAVAALPD